VFVYRNAFNTLFSSTSVPATALAGTLSTISNRQAAAARRSSGALGRTFVAEWRRSWASAAHRRDRDRSTAGAADPTASRRLTGGSAERFRRDRRPAAATGRERPATDLVDEPVAVDAGIGLRAPSSNGNGSQPSGD
jgi:hypothetical protein